MQKLFKGRTKSRSWTLSRLLGSSKLYTNKTRTCSSTTGLWGTTYRTRTRRCASWSVWSSDIPLWCVLLNRSLTRRRLRFMIRARFQTRYHLVSAKYTILEKYPIRENLRSLCRLAWLTWDTTESPFPSSTQWLLKSLISWISKASYLTSSRRTNSILMLSSSKLRIFSAKLTSFRTINSKISRHQTPYNRCKVS